MKARSDPVFLVEGDVDRAVLQGLRQRQLLTFPADRIYPKDPKEEAGRAAALKRARSWVSEVKSEIPRKIVLLLDLDTKSPEELLQEVRRFLDTGDDLRFLESFPVLHFANQNASLLLLYAGLAHKGLSFAGTRIQFRKAEMEDYLLALMETPETYQALQESERLKPHPREQVLAKILEIRDLLDQQEMPLVSAKELLEVWKALVGFRASPATLAQRIVEKAPEDRLRQMFGPWLQALRAFLQEP